MARGTRSRRAVESDEKEQQGSDVDMRDAGSRRKSGGGKAAAGNRRGGRRAAVSDDEEEEEEAEEEEEEEEEAEEGDDEYPAEKALEHLFIQTILARRTVTQKLGQAILDSCAKICNVPIVESRDGRREPNIEQMRARLDKVLSKLEMSFTGRIDEVTGVNLYTVTNMVSDDTAKLATEYKPEELVFFKVIVEKMMFARNMAYAVSHKDALACARDKRVTASTLQSQAARHDLIRTFVAKGWFDVDQDTNALYLSQRSIRELGRYLRETFKVEDEDEADIDHSTPYVECYQCKHFVSHGWACPNAECSVRMHKHCTRTRMQGTRNCEKCSTPWHLEEDDRTKRGTPVGLSNGAKLAGSRDLAVDSDVEEEESEERRHSQAGKKGRQQQSQPSQRDELESDEEDESE